MVFKSNFSNNIKLSSYLKSCYGTTILFEELCKLRKHNFVNISNKIDYVTAKGLMVSNKEASMALQSYLKSSVK